MCILGRSAQRPVMSRMVGRPESERNESGRLGITDKSLPGVCLAVAKLRSI